MLVSMSPCCLASCAKKFSLRGLMVGVSAKKFALCAHNGSKLACSGVLGEFFRGPAVVGSHRANIVAPQPWPPAILLAVLTLRCAAEPYWWHGGQAAQATTHLVNVRMKGLRPPPIGLTCV